MVACAVTLLLLSAPLPKFRVKFVDLTHCGAYNDNRITDATWDLCLCGNTYAAMIDVDPTVPLCILHGHPIGMDPNFQSDQEKTYWPYSYVGNNSFSVAISRFPAYEPPSHLVMGKWERNGWKSIRKLNRLPEPRNTPLSLLRYQADGKVPAWALAYVRAHSSAGFEDHAVVDMTHGRKGNELIKLTYYPITPGYDTCMHDAEQIATFVYTNNRWVALDQCVKGYGKYEFAEMVWADPSGWFVTRAIHNGHDGFAWVYPV